MEDLFPETLEVVKPVTLDDILKCMKHYQQYSNKNRNKFVKSFGITNGGDYYEILWNNGESQCFHNFEKALNELNKVVQHLVK